jgi:hypothetical protein
MFEECCWGGGGGGGGAGERGVIIGVSCTLLPLFPGEVGSILGVAVTDEAVDAVVCTAAAPPTPIVPPLKNSARWITPINFLSPVDGL